VDWLLWLQEEGCETLNLITPTHFLPHILKALQRAGSLGFSLPLVYNTSGFERVETLRQLEGIVDVYLPDFKFWRSETANALCGAPDYPSAARSAIREMHRQVGDLRMNEEGIATKGLLVRHLVLPGFFEESKSILKWLAEEISIHTYMNLMGHFRPCYKAEEDPRLSNAISKSEYETVANWAYEEGLYRLDKTHRKLYPLIWRKNSRKNQSP
jgi:putative pyruvate formate lyase activating enzyme